MAHLYAVTSHKATSVNFSVFCNFTAPNDRNLLVARSNVVYVYTLRDIGLVLSLEIPLFGRVKGLEVYRPLSYEKDTIFVMVEHKQVCLLEFDAQSKQVITRAHSNVQDRIGKDADLGQKSLIDPDGRMVALRIYNGSLKLIPMDGISFREAFNITIEENRVVDVKFLYGCFRPTLCLLYEDNNHARHVKSISVDVRDKEVSPGPLSQNNVEYTASLLIPVPAPLNGVIIVGMMAISYVNGAGTTQTVEISPAQITSYCALNDTGSRYLLCDHRGQLMVLALAVENNKVVNIYTDIVGVTSIAETMNYLDHGLVFVGSALGDSQLVKLHAEKHPEHGNVEVLEVYKNTGPILDMCLVENDRSGGQAQLVTCSGAYKDGSLRIIRNGIGIQEQASLEVAGIKAVWSLRAGDQSEYDKYLVQSFITETRVLAMEGEELGEFEIAGFESQMPSVHCCNLAGDLLAQVTPQSVRLVDAVSHSLVDEYRADKTITVARSNRNQLVVGLSGGTLLYFEVDRQRKKLVLVTEKQLDQDVACVSLKIKSPSVDGDAMDVDAAESEKDTVIAVGMWTDNSVRLLALPSFEEVNKTILGTETQARDILLASFDSTHYLFVGMGDGHLVTYNVDFDTGGLPLLSNKRNGVIGTQPLSFSWFVHNSDLCIFACCDRPTIVYLRNKKILFSPVDSRNKEICAIASFHTELFPDCIALCSETELVIGIVEEIQKLHVQTVPLGEAPRRIAHCAAQRAYCVLTDQVVQGEHGEESVSRVLFFDDSNMSLITAFKLELLEQALAVISCKLDSKRYFAVGTAQIVNEDPEPTKGRILIFEVNEDRKSVTIVAERETKSGVYSLANVCDKLAAAITSKVQIYKLVSKDQGLVSNFGIQPELQSECSHQGHVLVLSLKSHGDFLLVGDMLRSLTVLQYKATEGIIEEAARDFSVHTLRAVEIMDGFDDLFLGCEDFGNLFSLKRRADAASDEERSRLESNGYFHLGDYVNTMRKGTLISQLIDNDAMQTNETVTKTTIFDVNYRSVTGYSTDHQHSVVYGTISGAIGSIIALTEPSYQFFSAVEKAVKTVVEPIGRLNHQDWRSFKSEIKIAPQKNILDGDLIETIMDLSYADLELVTKEVNNVLTTIASTTAPENVTTGSVSSLISSLASQRNPFSPEDLLQRVEDISRLH